MLRQKKKKEISCRVMCVPQFLPIPFVYLHVILTKDVVYTFSDYNFSLIIVNDAYIKME